MIAENDSKNKFEDNNIESNQIAEQVAFSNQLHQAQPQSQLLSNAEIINTTPVKQISKEMLQQHQEQSASNFDLVQKQQQMIDLSNKKSRRTKNDQKNRNFQCGCGKSYLSYPALYTHLKQKHNGKQPDGTNYPRGRRPRMEDEDGIKIEKTDEEKDPLEELLLLLKSLGFQTKVQDMSQEQSCRILSAFCKDTLLNEESQYVPVIKILEEFFSKDPQELYRELEIKDQPIINESNAIRPTKLNTIFAIFLYEIAHYVNSACFKELSFFVCLYRMALNELGWEYLRQCKQDIVSSSKTIEGENKDNQTSQTQITQNSNSNTVPSNIEGEFCALNTGEFALEICNQFVSVCLPKYLQKYKPDPSFIIFNPDLAIRSNNLQNVTKHFCNWLFFKNYSQSKLVFTQEVQNQIGNHDLQMENDEEVSTGGDSPHSQSSLSQQDHQQQILANGDQEIDNNAEDKNQQYQLTNSVQGVQS